MQGATRCFFAHFSLAYNSHGTVEKGYLQDDSFLYIARLLAIVVTERMSFVRERFLWVILREKSPHFSHEFLARRSDSLRCISCVREILKVLGKIWAAGG